MFTVFCLLLEKSIPEVEIILEKDLSFHFSIWGNHSNVGSCHDWVIV